MDMLKPDVVILPMCWSARKWAVDIQNDLRGAGFNALADLRTDCRFSDRLREWFADPSVWVAIFLGDDQLESGRYSVKVAGSHLQIDIGPEDINEFLERNGCSRD